MYFKSLNSGTKTVKRRVEITPIKGIPIARYRPPEKMLPLRRSAYYAEIADKTVRLLLDLGMDLETDIRDTLARDPGLNLEAASKMAYRLFNNARLELTLGSKTKEYLKVGKT